MRENTQNTAPAGLTPTLSLSLGGAAALASLGSAGYGCCHTERDRTASGPNTLTLEEKVAAEGLVCQKRRGQERRRRFYPTPTSFERLSANPPPKKNTPISDTKTSASVSATPIRRIVMFGGATPAG